MQTGFGLLDTPSTCGNTRRRAHGKPTFNPPDDGPREGPKPPDSQPGYMDLCIEALGYNDHEGRPVYSVAHYGEQNGDLMRDPDVTMGVDRETGTVEPLTYQNDYIGRYWEVYKDFVDGKPTKYYPAMKKDLAAMVTAWAKNIKAQGFDPAVHV